MFPLLLFYNNCGFLFSLAFFSYLDIFDRFVELVSLFGVDSEIIQFELLMVICL